ncbi:MAG: hypothetical protein ACRDVM_07810 [Acidimicrobiia bacterium]
MTRPGTSGAAGDGKPAARARVEAPVLSLWPTWAWLMVGVVVTVLGLGVVGAILSPSLLLDAVSLWPLPAVAGGAGLVVEPFRRRRRRLGAVLPLGLLSWLALAVATHLGGWDPLPSSSADLVGPPGNAAPEAALVATIEGDLRVTTGRDRPLYSVEPVRRGGEVGVPVADEQRPDRRLRVQISETAGGSWFRFAGWWLELSEGPAWTLELGGNLEADLSRLLLVGLELAGGGVVHLPPPGGPVPVEVEGDFQVTVPAGAPVEVRGEAQVLDDWAPTEDGYRSPVSGEGFVITVQEGAKLRLSTR